MPFIHIKSLPFEKTMNIPCVLKSISRDFSKTTNTEISHVHVTWEFFQTECYVKGCESAIYQPEVNFPIMVNLYPL